MSENQLRDALKILTAPADAPGSAEQILVGVRRRRTSRAITVGVGALAAAALVVAAVVWSPWREDPAPADPTTSTGSDDWAQIASSPLSARTGAVSVWTGSEMVVAGGVEATCPDGADCAGPSEDQIRSDGAAYDPAADSWRPIAEAPMALIGSQAVWTGSEMVVLAVEYHVAGSGDVRLSDTDYRLLGYDPAADSWREISFWAGTTFEGLVLAGENAVVAYASVDDLGQRLHVFDLETGLVTALPADPFGSGFDRDVVWTGEELMLTELAESGDPDTFQLATITLDGGAWTEQPATPVTFWSQRWFAFDGHLVHPNQEALVTSGTAAETSHGALDLATGEWGPVPQVDGDPSALLDACQLPRVGAAGDWLAGGDGSLVSLEPAVAVAVPPCGGQRPAAAVWTGSAFLIWGGATGDGTDLTSEGSTWTPPPPSDIS